MFCNIVVMFGCRFAAEGMTLGKDEKRVKQVLTIPIDDSGEEDLYSHLSDSIHFIGKKRECGRKGIIHTFPIDSVLSILSTVSFFSSSSDNFHQVVPFVLWVPLQPWWSTL